MYFLFHYKDIPFLKTIYNFVMFFFLLHSLKRTFLLVDGKVGFQKWDEVALDMLEEFKVPYGVSKMSIFFL